jgi:hypothetical protein
VKVDGYSFGRIEIEGEIYRSDVIVFADHVVSGWRRVSGHRLREEDLEDVFEVGVSCLVVGTGAVGAMKVPEETVQALEARGIRVIAHRTGRAVEAFNRLSAQRGVAAAFHLTC